MSTPLRTTVGDPAVANALQDALAGWGAVQPLQFFTGDFLYLAVVFFVLAVLAAVMGARGVAGLSMEIARILVVVFVILAIVSLVL